MKKTSHAKFAERFHHLLESLFREVDQVALKKEIDDLVARKPGVPREKLAKRLIDRAAVSTAVVGAGAGAPGGAIGVIAMAPDIFNLVRQQSRLVLSIAFLYGRRPDLEDRFKEVLATLAVSTGASAGRQGVRYLIERGFEADFAKSLARRIAGRFIERKLPDLAPVVGSIAGAGLNYFAVQATGKVAVEYFSKLEKKAASEAAASQKPTKSPRRATPTKKSRAGTGTTTKARAPRATAKRSAAASKAGKKKSPAKKKSSSGTKKAAPRKAASKASKAPTKLRRKSAAKTSAKPETAPDSGDAS